MQNRPSIYKINMLCFIYINSWFIYIATKQKDKEAKCLVVLIANLLLNQEDELVECKATNDNNKDK